MMRPSCDFQKAGSNQKQSSSTWGWSDQPPPPPTVNAPLLPKMMRMPPAVVGGHQSSTGVKMTEQMSKEEERWLGTTGWRRGWREENGRWRLIIWIKWNFWGANFWASSPRAFFWGGTLDYANIYMGILHFIRLRWPDHWLQYMSSSFLAKLLAAEQGCLRGKQFDLARGVLLFWSRNQSLDDQ